MGPWAAIGWDVWFAIGLIAYCLIIMKQPKILERIAVDTGPMGTSTFRSVVRVPLVLVDLALPPHHWWRSFWRLAAVYWSLAVPLVCFELFSNAGGRFVSLGWLLLAVNVQVWVGIVLVLVAFGVTRSAMQSVFAGVGSITARTVSRAALQVGGVTVVYFVGMLMLQTFITELAVRGDWSALPAAAASSVRLLTGLGQAAVCPFNAYAQCTAAAVTPTAFVLVAATLWLVFEWIRSSLVMCAATTAAAAARIEWRVGACQVAAVAAFYVAAQLAA